MTTSRANEVVRDLGLVVTSLAHDRPDANATYVTNFKVPEGNGSDPNADAAMLFEVVNWTTFVLHGILGNLLVILGLLGNTLSIVVLCNRRMRSSTSYYMTSLAVYDNFILVSLILFFNIPALGLKISSFNSLWESYQFLVPVFYPPSLAAQMGSIYTCVAFTVERFIAVCRPLHAANTCTKSRAKRAILLIFLWAMVYNIPRCFYYEYEMAHNNETGEYSGKLDTTDFGKDKVFQHVYIIYLHLIFMFLVPFIIILLLNTALLRAINRSRQQRQLMSTSDTREHNLTVMLVAVIIVFLVCQFPTIVDNTLMAIIGEEQHAKMQQYQMLYVFCTFLVTINASINFILYCLFGKKFRMVLYHILGLDPRANRRANGGESHYRSTVYHARSNGTSTKVSQCDMEVSLV